MEFRSIFLHKPQSMGGGGKQRYAARGCLKRWAAYDAVGGGGHVAGPPHGLFRVPGGGVLYDKY